MKRNVEFLDLPDELILAIMSKVERRVELLCSIIGIGNSRLELLAQDKFHSIDLTFDYYHSPQELLIRRFYSHVMPRIYNRIQSLAINFQHLATIINAAIVYADGILPSLTHLKINGDHRHARTGTLITTNSYYSQLRRYPLVSTIPELFLSNAKLTDRLLLFFRCSPLIHSIVSFEFDDCCALPVPSNDDRLFFAQSSHLTHVRVTLRHFDDCVRLLSQLGFQVCSFVVSLVQVYESQNNTSSQMTSVSCPNLRTLTLTIYRNIVSYEQCLVPLLQRLSSVEHLTLLLAIGIKSSGPDHFIDGADLQRDIVSSMPHLRQFDFHIRSILRDAPFIESDIIRQSFVEQKQPVDCALDYFNNHYGQCHLYSLPFLGTRLDFISNRFPLMDVNNRFLNVTTLLLFDDVKSFERVFFELVTRALPRLRTLEVQNYLKQQENLMISGNNLEFPKLTTLILYDIHVDYADQLLCRARLPHLVELTILQEPLLTIIAQDQQQARENCSKIETLRIPESSMKSTSACRNFFPSFYSKNL